MANKASWISTVNGFITAIITQAKLRSAFSTTADALYPTEVIDSQTTETHTTKGGTNINYSVCLSKQGNHVAIKIYNLRNTTTSALDVGQTVFTWKDTEYQPKATVNKIVIQSFRGADRLGLLVDETGVYLNDSMLTSSTSFKTEFTIYIAKV